MRRMFAVFALLLACASSAHATGLLIPTEKKLPPLALLNQQVFVRLEDQVAVTQVEQTFRNHTDRELEATFIFPVPKGASVREFAMWIDGKKQVGELLEAAKAKQIYTDIVRRTLDPGLLEYMGQDLLKLSVFPVPAKGEQKITLSFTSVASADKNLIEYVYPLRTDGKAARTLEKFSLKVELKSQHPIQTIYSPSHAITTQRPNDKTATIVFEKDQAILDRDFQLFYSLSDKDVGLTFLGHRPDPTQPGHFLMLLSPRAELSKTQQVPRDMVFVIDTSGSMRGKRIEQARNALKFCIENLGEKDRYTMINFATVINKFSDKLIDANGDNLSKGRKWVEALETTGGTAINDAMSTALDLRPSEDNGRTFTIVFFTDGLPTIGETNPEKILANVAKKNNANTRIFTFGFGDDVNTVLLDRMADQSRAISTYVRESESIDTKVASLYAKISNPVLANLKLTVGEGITLSEIYPPQLPDLFHGSQLVVFGRYTGKGATAVKLTGNVGKDAKEFVYETTFAEKTNSDKAFVEDLWARRKVGYLLEQIRTNGEKKELVEEVTALAKKYSIATPYTSWLVVPDTIPVAGPVGGPRPAVPNVGFHLGAVRDGKEAPAALAPAGPGKAQVPLGEFLKKADVKAGKAGEGRGDFMDKALDKVPVVTASGGFATDDQTRRLQEAKQKIEQYRQANRDLAAGHVDRVQNGRAAVEYALDANCLRNQTQLTRNAQQRIGKDRNAVDVGGVWIDDGYDVSMKTVTVKAMSNAYFKLLEKHPEMRDVFRLGNHLVWVSPSRTALVIDTNSGEEEITEEAIADLFRPAPVQKN